MTATVVLLRADSAAWTLPALRRLPAQPRHRPVVRPRASCAGTPLPYGETVLTSRRGITSHHANPWVMVDAGEATEDHGRGVVRGAGLER